MHKKNKKSDTKMPPLFDLVILHPLIDFYNDVDDCWHITVKRYMPLVQKHPHFFADLDESHILDDQIKRFLILVR